jgi:hypothetical protein
MLLSAPTTVLAHTVANPICPDNTAQFDPGNGQDIVVPARLLSLGLQVRAQLPDRYRLPSRQ